jgi:hypothetical protein
MTSASGHICDGMASSRANLSRSRDRLAHAIIAPRNPPVSQCAGATCQYVPLSAALVSFLHSCQLRTRPMTGGSPYGAATPLKSLPVSRNSPLSPGAAARSKDEPTSGLWGRVKPLCSSTTPTARLASPRREIGRLPFKQSHKHHHHGVFCVGSRTAPFQGSVDECQPTRHVCAVVTFLTLASF